VSMAKERNESFKKKIVFLYRTGKLMNNLLSYCGLLDPRIRASDKDLPVQKTVKRMMLPVPRFNKCM
jgi:hypothetical protein